MSQWMEWILLWWSTELQERSVSEVFRGERLSFCQEAEDGRMHRKLRKSMLQASQDEDKICAAGLCRWLQIYQTNRDHQKVWMCEKMLTTKTKTKCEETKKQQEITKTIFNISLQWTLCLCLFEISFRYLREKAKNPNVWRKDEKMKKFSEVFQSLTKWLSTTKVESLAIEAATC